MGHLAYVARRFVAGEKMDQAMEAVRLLNLDGLVATLDFLGENVMTTEEAKASADEYIALLDQIARSGVKSNVSIKLTAMGLDISDAFVLENVGRILERAKKLNNFVRIDMEGSPYTERTIQVFRTLREKYDNVGVVLQAYLHRSEEDARKLAAIQAPIRVCKGAYKEPASIAYQSMDQIRESYKAMVQILLKGKSRVGIATHDERLIRWALEWTAKENIPRDQFEFQMLYGLRRARGRELARQGYTVRSYVPYGTHWFPYFVRRLRERKENVFFVLRSLVAD